MPMFHYEAQDRSGKTVVGAMDARDEGALRARLAQGGYTPTLIEVAGAPSRGAASRGAVQPGAGPLGAGPLSAGPLGAAPPPGGSSYWSMGASAPPSALSGPGVAAGQGAYGLEVDGESRPGVKVSTRALAQFYRQMASSIRSGVPLTQVLPGLKGRVRDPIMRRALDDIEAAVAHGRPISEAMALHPGAFSLGHIGLVRAGEGGGFLDRAYEELATQAEADWGVEAATRFNILLFLIKWMGVPFLVAWLWFMVKFMPQIQNGFNANAFTRITMEALVAGLVAAVVLNVLFPVLFRLARGTRLGDQVNNLASDIPLLNARRKRVDAVKTLSSLASAISAGVPTTIAWQLASEAPDTPKFRQAMASQRHAVRQGMPLPEVLAATRLFDQDTLDMVQSGEVSGNMPEMLAQAIHYQREEAKHIGNLTPWIIAVVAYFLLLILAAALFIWGASQVYGGMIDKGLNF